MRRTIWTGLIFGVALFVAVVAYQGVGDVLAAVAVAVAGWGLLLVALVHWGVILADAASWRALLGPGPGRSLPRLIWMWWVGDALNALLPVAQIGGEFLRARLLSRGGVPGPLAGASVVVGLTAGVLTLFLFAASGAVLAVFFVPGDGTAPLRLAVALAVLAALLGAFYLAQRGGLFLKMAHLLERLAGGREWLAFAGEAAVLDRNIADLYGQRGRFLMCCAGRALAWLVGALEVWLALHLLGFDATFTEAFILEALGQLAKSAGFAIPGALGVQEGGFLIIGLQLGVPGEVALGVSLIKRVRDLLLGLPALLSWKLAEAMGKPTPISR